MGLGLADPQPQRLAVHAEIAGDGGDRAASVEHAAHPALASSSLLLRCGVDRGELRADLDLEEAIDMLVGPIVYRVLISGGD